ncbi:LysR family transcriptional regulator [Piscinibacter sakaiensis]|uniref:Transcriptional regulator, LysR family n=1 Tax=Piscinibacter sakaiensis TaxID=1547922 RepID=A0A0K8P1W3_PISS1|nr:LysR family transcriptional regulator [Piscinibacter sakaiensis]GAP36539.1 transcriptional regulator, LysR family [Piscinibacter sakaiensis]
MDRLDAMAVFTAIADAGSLSGAGRALHLPLATVSRKLADLEAHLGTRLVTRTTRRLELTEAGHGYLAACRQILERVDEAERTAAGAYAEVKGTLVVAAPIVFGRLHLVPLAAEFLEAHPAVDLQLILGDRNVDLIDAHVDLALRIGELPDSGLVATRVGRVRRIVCASPAYLARHGTPRTPDDLAAHRCIAFAGLDAATPWSFVGAGGTRRLVPVRPRLGVSTAEAALDAAELGLGLTRVLSYQAADALRQGRLVRVLADDEPPALPVSLVHPGGARLPMKTRAFLDLAAARLRERLA